MITTTTKLNNMIAVVDSDALIALFNKDDANTRRAEKLFEAMYEQQAQLIYPSTTLIETVDTIQRRIKKHQLYYRLFSLLAMLTLLRNP